ncbi:hypothetical protein PFISCL1PPCAC_14723, partial [Pristionchus fissidentatus]
MTSPHSTNAVHFKFHRGDKKCPFIASVSRKFVSVISDLRCTNCQTRFGTDCPPQVPFCGHLMCKGCLKVTMIDQQNGPALPGFKCKVCSYRWDSSIVNDTQTPFYVQNEVLCRIYNTLENSPSFRCVNCSHLHPRLNVVGCLECQSKRAKEKPQEEEPGPSNKPDADGNFYTCVWCAVDKHAIHDLRLVEESEKPIYPSRDDIIFSIDFSTRLEAISLLYCCLYYVHDGIKRLDRNDFPNRSEE